MENENQTIVPPNDAQNELITQHEPPDQGTNFSNFRYPPIACFSSFLLPPKRPMEECNDTSHIPKTQLTSLEDEVERDMSDAPRKGKLSMPHGEGSIKNLDHSDTFSPLTTNIDKVFHNFWTVGETIK